MLIVIAGMLFSVAAVVCYGISLQTLTLLLLYGILTAIAWIDWKTQTIPPLLNIMIGIVGILSCFTMPGPTVTERLIGFVCISVPMYLVVLFVPGGFGGGDIKMMAATGLLLGWKGTVAAFLIGLLSGGCYGIWLLAARKKSRKDHFAFGPFLSLGVAVAAFGGTGAMLVDLYLQMTRTML